MNVIRRRGWEMPESRATPEHLFFNRRTCSARPRAPRRRASRRSIALAQRVTDQPDPTIDLYPGKRNETFTLDRPITDEKINGNYNNFYEFNSSKNVAKQAQALKIRPWTIKIDGMVEKPFEVGIDDLVRKFRIEERLYRHRCVEAWSMAVPWSGFPLAKLVELAKPLSSATYVRMETFLDKSIAPGQKQSWFPWPYVEGLTMAEATNELAFLATGAYGKPIAKQHGAPIRLAVPWKYGFKSHQVDRARHRSPTSGRRAIGRTCRTSEYGFWANVNPEVPHPRWSQATEELIGTGERRPTLLFNGYGEYVAGLYKGLEDKERLWA